MQRQKSILSFFQKPSDVKQSTGASSCSVHRDRRDLQSQSEKANQGAAILNKHPLHNVEDLSLEIKGTDTPPEKESRRIFPLCDDSRGSSLFSSIMHKFVKVEDKGKNGERNHDHVSSTSVSSNHSNFHELRDLPAGVATQHFEKNKHSGSNRMVCQESILPIEIIDDVDGPETPGLKPLSSRFKRIKDDSTVFEDKSDLSPLRDIKRVKFLHDSPPSLSKSNKDLSDTASKFEWLDPFRIRDASGRRPDDPLYDKKTLYIPPDVLKKMSASQKQYWSIKCQYMDVVLFFKVGKFYELYEVDAEVGHRELDWKMTFSGVGKCRQVGISENGIDEAVQKLVARGYKVGRIEQLETSESAKARGANSVIARKLIHVVTPSTVVDGNIGPDAVHLLALKEENYGKDNGSTVYGFAFVDCAALRFWVGSINDDDSCAALGALMMQVSPKEVVYDSRGLSKGAQKALRKYSAAGSTPLQLNPTLPVTDFVNASEVRNIIESKGYFKGSSNSWSDVVNNVEDHDTAFSALGGLISHLSRLMLDDCLRNGDILPYQVYTGCLRMDGQTMVNLEIFSNNADGGPAGTLLKHLDNCITSSGKRLLRNWISHPLRDVDGINNRLDVVEDLTGQSEIMFTIAQYLRKIPDIERLLGRVKASSDASSHLLPIIGTKVVKQRVKVFGVLTKGLQVAIDLLKLLQKEEKLIVSLSRVFQFPELEGNGGLDKLLNQFIAAVDSDFPNYQNHDIKDSDAETLSILIELFLEKATQWSEVICSINHIDVLRSFALTACMSAGPMSRPVILPQSKTSLGHESTRPILKIKGLWHPFALGENGGQPVPNDLFLGEGLDGFHPRTLLLTGPNMGGKSTLLRTTCIAVILAQLGCFVPSETCALSLVDIIFTRLGANDRIMTGESTFLIECSETASVLQNATQDSLVILDELGRGTSTFDGYAIAYAVLRHLVEKVNCRLLFATHYHPLTKEFATHPHVTLQHMSCAFTSKSKELSNTNEELIFLYRLANGACPKSYGLQVAIMAGIPKKIVDAASQAAEVMKKSISQSFKSSEHRSVLSTLHEEWLKMLLQISFDSSSNADETDDLYDTLFCLWHEVKSSYQH